MRGYDKITRVVTAEDGSQYQLLSPAEFVSWRSQGNERKRIWCTSIDYVIGGTSDIYQGKVTFADMSTAAINTTPIPNHVYLVKIEDYTTPDPAWGKVSP